MKKLLIYCLFLTNSLGLVSCIYTEEKMPAQSFFILFEKKDIGLSFSSRIPNTSIDTLQLSTGQVAYEINLPTVRWGQGIFLGYVYRGKNPETDEDLFCVSKKEVELYYLSIAQIKTLEYFMADTKQVFILPVSPP